MVRVLWENDECSINVLEERMGALRKDVEQAYKKYNKEPELITSVKIDVGVTDTQVNSLKETLRRAKAMHVNYSNSYAPY